MFDAFATLSEIQITTESKELRKINNTNNLPWFTPQLGITFGPLTFRTQIILLNYV